MIHNLHIFLTSHLNLLKQVICYLYTTNNQGSQAMYTSEQIQILSTLHGREQLPLTCRGSSLEAIV